MTKQQKENFSEDLNNYFLLKGLKTFDPSPYPLYKDNLKKYFNLIKNTQLVFRKPDEEPKAILANLYYLEKDIYNIINLFY